jgi:hypothetical protein
MKKKGESWEKVQKNRRKKNHVGNTIAIHSVL